MLSMKELEGMTRSHISSERQFIRDRINELISSDDLARAYSWPFEKDEARIQTAAANEKALYKKHGSKKAENVYVKLYGDMLYVFKKGEADA